MNNRPRQLHGLLVTSVLALGLAAAGAWLGRLHWLGDILALATDYYVFAALLLLLTFVWGRAWRWAAIAIVVVSLSGAQLASHSAVAPAASPDPERALRLMVYNIYHLNDDLDRPKNSVAPAGRRVELSRSRLALISTAGGYLPATQAPFDAANPLGDYTIRRFPSAAPLSEIAYAHDHYDHTAVDADPQVLLPLGHLAELVAEGQIGALTPNVISFMGYQPDVGRVLDELIPAIRAAVQAEGADAALLVPS